MSGHKTAGAGQPLFFHCPKYRSARATEREAAYLAFMLRAHREITLTGRTRKVRKPNGQRMTKTAREYRCTCGHVGWSRHVDLERLSRLPGKPVPRYSRA